MNNIFSFSFYICENYNTVDIIATEYREAYEKMLVGLDNEDIYFELSATYQLGINHYQRYLVG